MTDFVTSLLWLMECNQTILHLKPCLERGNIFLKSSDTMKRGKAINVLKHYYNLDFVVETSDSSLLTSSEVVPMMPIDVTLVE